MPRFDITEVTNQLLKGNVQDKLLLLNEFSDAMTHNPLLRNFMARLFEVALEQGLGPRDLGEMFLRHGMLLGVLLEREKKQRKVH